MTYPDGRRGRRQFGHVAPSELPDKFAMATRVPVGVAGLITPWNFPMAIPSWKAMPALICGNTVVLKPAEDTPLSTYNLAQVLTEAGLPPGVLNVVFGYGPQAGAPLLQKPGIDLVSFTGSTETGRIVSEACAPTFKKCHLEMGGKNIIIVMDDANLDLAIEGALWGGFGTTGQRCTAASRVAVQKGVYRKFVEKFARGARESPAPRWATAWIASTQMGPCINEQQLRRLVICAMSKSARRGRARGWPAAARLVQPLLEGVTYARGWFHEPTVFTDCKPRKVRICQEEIFGPVVAVMPFDTFDEAPSRSPDGVPVWPFRRRFTPAT